MVFLLIVSTLAAGLFAGAAIYVSAVEHPARVSCGADLAVREFAPSYKRGAIMQASLALVGCMTGFIGGWQLNDIGSIIAALLLGAVVPFTLIVFGETRISSGLASILNATTPILSRGWLPDMTPILEDPPGGSLFGPLFPFSYHAQKPLQFGSCTKADQS